MFYPKMLRALSLGAALTSSALLSACGGERTTSAQTTAAQQREPVPLVIQMTGLLLLAPDSSSGRTHVLMPPMPDTLEHVAWIGFFKRDSAQSCKRYDSGRKICYVDVDRSSLEIIPPRARSANVGGRVPRGALNLTRASGSAKFNLAAARSRSRSDITLGSGSATDSCGVAEWTFNPAGSDPPARIRLINVLEWQTPEFGADSLVLVVKRRGQAAGETFVAEKNDHGEIELLIMHVPSADTVGMFDRSPPPESLVVGASEHDMHSEDGEVAATREHLHRLYSLIGVSNASRRFPRRPVRVQEVCPITILDLHDFQPDVHRAMGTYSCIMASADAGP
jgi:hypothetical protein